MLSEKRIRDTKPEAKPIVIWDGQVKGLGMKVQPGGTKSFILSYRVGGRKRLANIARCSEMPLREARKRAGSELVRIRDGEADPLERRRQAKEAPSMAEGVERFFGEFVPRRMADGRLSKRTERNYRKQWARLLVVWPAFGSRKIRDVTWHDVEKVVAPCGPVERNRTLAFMSRLFNLFESWELRPQHSNPTRNIEKAKEEPRDRVLAPSEIHALDAALDKIDDPFSVACIRFLLMTGWRSGEALSLKWEQINSEAGEIALPDTKTGRQVRTVATTALHMLMDVPRINDNPFVFAGARSAAISYKTLRSCFGRACKQAGIQDSRLHDIRRTVATLAAASGLSVFLVRDLLNHSTLAMANRYVRRANVALQEAQDASAVRMAEMMAGKGGELVPSRGPEPLLESFC